ncbi:MAG: tetratricopeptide repeat protein 27 [Blastocatellia bacterium]|jgi:protein involved in polysaccharide export with SLBB domain/lipoprotein NlpI|nr:tetratricopeptide repeat protein 27 [Blastocatellia bacterium]
MIKKVLSALIFLLALGLPVCAATQEQQQQAPPQNDAVKSTEKQAGASAQQQPVAERKDATDFYKIGLAHYESKQFKDAVDAFKRASRLNPKDADIQYNLGLAYYSSNMYKEAAKAYEQAARLRPDWADAHFRLGWMYYIIGKKDASFDQYKILQKLNSEQAATLYRIIKVEPTNRPNASRTETKAETTARTKQPAQPDPKDDAKVESRLVVSELSQPIDNAPANALNTSANTPTTTATPEKESETKPDSTSTTAAPTAAANEPSTKTTTPPATNNSSPSSVPTTSNVAAASSATISSTSAPAKTESKPEPKNDAPAKESNETSATTDEAALVKTYRVGVGDVLDIRLMNTPTTRSTLYTVMEGGLIEYPLAGGPLTVSGLTTEEINTRLSAELKRRAVNQNPNEIVVSVRDYASHNVVISGLVNNPGMRILHREAVPLYVVLADAQPRIEASRALIMRASGQVSVDLTDPAQMNMLVRPGDVITVSARPPQFYYLGGKIMTPGQKPFQQDITLVQAILAAGGLVDRTSGDAIDISREGEGGRLTTTRYKLKEIRSGKVPDPRLQPGDRIEVSH